MADGILNPLERSPGLNKLYTQLCFFWEMPAQSKEQKNHVIKHMEDALQALAKVAPWLAAKTELRKEDGDEDEYYKIVHHLSSPELVVKDYAVSTTDSFPSMQELQAAKFPSSLLSESLFAPRPTLAASEDKVFPNLLLQATFIENGFVLCVNGLHSVMDMVGQGHIMRLLSDICNGRQTTDQRIADFNPDRKNSLPIAATDYDPIPYIQHQIMAPQETKTAVEVGSTGTSEVPTAVSETPQPLKWVYFDFSAAAQETLKKDASSSLPPSIQFISTDDALTALIWRATTRARQSRLLLTSSPSTTIQIARALDPRSLLSVPESYPGLVQTMAYTSLPLTTLCSSFHTSLSETASALRSTLNDRTTLRKQAIDFITACARSPGNPTYNVIASLKPDRDIALSSWTKVRTDDLDFGLGLGMPVCVRRPSFIPVEGLMYFMPKQKDGSIALLLALKDDEIERLRGDEELMRYAEYIG